MYIIFKINFHSFIKQGKKSLWEWLIFRCNPPPSHRNHQHPLSTSVPEKKNLALQERAAPSQTNDSHSDKSPKQIDKLIFACWESWLKSKVWRSSISYKISIESFVAPRFPASTLVRVLPFESYYDLGEVSPHPSDQIFSLFWNKRDSRFYKVGGFFIHLYTFIFIISEKNSFLFIGKFYNIFFM